MTTCIVVTFLQRHYGRKEKAMVESVSVTTCKNNIPCVGEMGLNYKLCLFSLLKSNFMR